MTEHDIVRVIFVFVVSQKAGWPNPVSVLGAVSAARASLELGKRAWNGATSGN